MLSRHRDIPQHNWRYRENQQKQANNIRGIKIKLYVEKRLEQNLKIINK